MASVELAISRPGLGTKLSGAAFTRLTLMRAKTVSNVANNMGNMRLFTSVFC